MNVQELINLLESLENKTLPVFLYGAGDITKLNKDMIDLTISDRIDINIPMELEEEL